jgi:N6-L-threonylcarbamoyladenine synthase
MKAYTLGIESSCDETSLAVVRNRKVSACVVASSIAFHKRFGGIVPEIASRKQLEVIAFLLGEVLKKSRIGYSDIGLVAVTQAPGLIGSLLVGASFANALAYARGIKLAGVNHLKAHLFSAFLNNAIPIDRDFIGLVVSGGHTSIVHSRGFKSFTILGSTRDDAAGEAFDKIAKILGLGFPGGPRIARYARYGKASQALCIARKDIGLDFSFSGIKTAVLYAVQARRKKKRFSKQDVYDLARATQETIVEDVVGKTLEACRRKSCAIVVAGGGVTANAYLRSRLEEETKKRGIALRIADRKFTTDNAAMIAGLGEFEVQYRIKDACEAVEPRPYAQW